MVNAANKLWYSVPELGMGSLEIEWDVTTSAEIMAYIDQGCSWSSEISDQEWVFTATCIK
jgi:hypothetical protein